MTCRTSKPNMWPLIISTLRRSCGHTFRVKYYPPCCLSWQIVSKSWPLQQHGNSMLLLPTPFLIPAKAWAVGQCCFLRGSRYLLKQGGLLSWQKSCVVTCSHGGWWGYLSCSLPSVTAGITPMMGGEQRATVHWQHHIWGDWIEVMWSTYKLWSLILRGSY